MKFSIKSLLLLLAVASLSIVACKDDEKSNADKLTAASCWKLSKTEGYVAATDTWTNTPIDDCSKDDCIVFNSIGTVTFDEGATKCDPADPQTGSGTWVLSADGTTLTVIDNGGASSFSGTITEFTDSKLVVETDISAGFKARLTFTN